MGIKRLGRAALVVTLLASALIGPGGVSSASAPGGELIEEVVPHEVGENAQIRLDSVTAFAVEGGEGTFEPNTTNEEVFWYERVDVDTGRLLGLTRPEAESHPVGSFVAAVESSTPAPATPWPSEATEEPQPTASPPDSSSASETEGVSGTDPQGNASSAEVVPEPCELVNECDLIPPIECSGCEVVDEIIGMIGIDCSGTRCADSTIDAINNRIYETCGPNGLLGCEPEVVRVLIGIINVYCPSGLTTCADPTINLVTDIVMDLVCPSGSLGYCAGELSRQINEQLAFVVGVAQGLALEACDGSVPDACVQKVLDMLNTTALPIVCQANELFWCVDNMIRMVNNLVVSACSLGTSSTGHDPVTECVYRVLTTVQLVLKTVDDAMIIGCQSNDAGTCVTNLLLKIDLEIDRTCATVPGERNTAGVNECVEKLLQIVSLIVATAQAHMRGVCGSDDALVCAGNVLEDAFATLDRINDVAANLCRSGTSSALDSPTGDSATTNCVALVLQTTDTLMNTACRSTDPVTCATNLLDTVDAAVGIVCGVVPVANGGQVVGTTPGIGTCVQKTLGTVNLAMTAACRSTDAGTCADNIRWDLEALADRINDTVAVLCKTPTGAMLGSTTDSAVSNCVALVLQTVDTLMNTVCRSADPLTCATNLLDTVDAAVGMVCGVVPVTDGGAVTGTPAGVGACVLKVLGAIGESMRIACGSTDEATCADNIEQALVDLAKALVIVVARSCSREDTSTDASAGDGADECVELVMAESQTVISTLCGSRSLEECPTLVAEAVTRLAAEGAGSILTLAETMKIKLMAVVEEYCFRNQLDTACAIGMVEAIRGPLGDALMSLCPDLHCTAVAREMLEEIIRDSCDDPECLQVVLVTLGCPSGEPPYEAALIPNKIPSYCGIHGELVRDHGAGVEIPSTVEGVTNATVGDGGTNVLSVETEENGTVVVSDVGPEAPPSGEDEGGEAPAEPEPVEGLAGAQGTLAMNHIGPPACRDEEFDYAGFREDATHIWGIDTDTIPHYVEHPDLMIAALRHGFYNINHAVTDCDGFSDQIDSPDAHYDGDTDARTNITQAGQCSDNRDKINVTDFVYMRDTHSSFAICVRWYDNPMDPFNVPAVTEADVRLNTRYLWTANPGPNCPENKFDAESVSTFARGFTYGLSGLNETAHGNLSMSTGFAYCDESQRTLGKGDIWGLEGIYP